MKPTAPTLLLLLFNFMLATPGQGDLPAGKTVHVSPDGADKANGSSETPVRTIRRALQIAERGDVVNLAAGVYAGGVATRVPGVQLQGTGNVLIRGPERDRAIEILHSETVL